MKSLYSAIVLLFLTLNCLSNPHLQWVEIGVDGLTCSQCTRNVELSLRRLDFIKNVEMDLENTNGKITFFDSVKVDYHAIAKAVRNAGFSVRYINSVLSVNTPGFKEGSCLNVNGTLFQMIKPEALVSAGDVRIKLIGKEFMPSKEFKKWNLPEAMCGNDAIFISL